MGSISIDLVTWAGYALAILVGLVAYRVGWRAGARSAHSVWTEWTGIRAEELQTHKFDRELRALRRDIGRPADAWPDQEKED
jgi:hypothetical protein